MKRPLAMEVFFRWFKMSRIMDIKRDKYEIFRLYEIQRRSSCVTINDTLRTRYRSKRKRRLLLLAHHLPKFR